MSKMESDIITEDTNQEQAVKVDEEKPQAFREKWKDAAYRRKCYQSLSLFGALFALGINAGQIGPVLLDLQIITDTDLEKASAFFTSGAIGYLSGTVLCGLVYGKVNTELLMFASVFFSALAAFTTPFCKYFELMMFIRFMASFSAGFIDTGGNALCMRIWGTEGEQLMQFLHFCFALGGVLSPLYSEPFLAPKPADNNLYANESVTQATLNLTSTNSSAVIPRETNVKYAFMISAILTTLLSIPFLPFYFMNRKKINKQKEEDKNQRKLPRIYMVLTVLLICIFLMNYCCVEDTFASFLMTFLVREYGSVSKSKGAIATAIYWAFFASGRFLMVFLSRLFSPIRLLSICISCMILSYTGFLVTAHYGIIDALIAFGAMAGFSMSGVFAAVFSWTEAEILKVNGFVAAAFLLFSSLAAVVNPLVLGYLMENVSNMWFCYLLLGESVFLAVMLLVLVVYTRFFLNRKFGNKMQKKKSESVQESFLSNDAHRPGDIQEMDRKC